LSSGVELGGSTGLNLLARVAGRDVVVRVHRAHVTAARVESLQLARVNVADEGVPAARPVTGRGGQLHLTVDEGPVVVEVEEFVSSDNKMDSLARIRRAMPILARLHDSLKGASLPEVGADAAFANYLSAAEAPAATLAGARRMRSLDSGLGALADTVEQLAADLDAATGPTFDDLPLQWCHGDFWDDNVLFGGDEVVLVADFGFMSRRPRVDDLALTLYFTLWELIASSHQDPLGAIATLVSEYDSATREPLSRAEREALPLAIARQPLWSIGVWAAHLDDPLTVAAHLTGHELAVAIGGEILDALDQWRTALGR
jgi:homoserine kinase type II